MSTTQILVLWSIVFATILTLIVIIVLQQSTIQLLTSKCDIKTLEVKNVNPNHNCDCTSFQNEKRVTLSEKLLSNTLTKTNPTYAGTAVTLFLGSPKWFQNRYSMMINLMVASLPPDWMVQIYYLPRNRMSREAVNYPGVRKQIKKGFVELVPIPDEYRKMKRKEIMLLPWLYRQMKSDKVLFFGGTSVLCSNSNYDLDNDFDRYDYIGSPWNDFNGVGGSGAISLRNRTAMLNILENMDEPPEMGKKEDFFLVEKLLGGNSTSVEGNRLASRADSLQFGISDSIKSFSDLGITTEHPDFMTAQGTLAALSDEERNTAIEFCPELKLFFPVLHSPNCFGANPKPLHCFKFLCEDGGLHCEKNGGALKFETEKKQEIISGSVSITVDSG